MSCRMEGYLYAININRFVVINALKRDRIAEPFAHDPLIEMVGKVRIHAVTGVIGVGMGNEGAFDLMLWVDIEIADFAVEAGRGLF